MLIVFFQAQNLHQLDWFFWILKKRYDSTLIYHTLNFRSGPKTWSFLRKIFKNWANFAVLAVFVSSSRIICHVALSITWILLNKEAQICEILISGWREKIFWLVFLLTSLGNGARFGSFEILIRVLYFERKCLKKTIWQWHNMGTPISQIPSSGYGLKFFLIGFFAKLTLKNDQFLTVCRYFVNF